jgi:hypothetical protein
MGGANGVTSGIAFSAAGCKFVNNRIITATTADLECTTCLSVAAGATSLKISKNKSRGVTGATTSVVSITGAAEDVEISDNDFQMPGSAAATGVIAVGAAATNLRILRNLLSNAKSDSTAALSVANVACTGVVKENSFVIYADGVAASTGIVFTSTGALLRCFDNKTCDEPRVSGVLSPAGCAT